MLKQKKFARAAAAPRALGRSLAAGLFSMVLGASAPALAAHGGGGFTGSGMHGGGFHGGGFHGGAMHAGEFRAGAFDRGAFQGANPRGGAVDRGGLRTGGFHDHGFHRGSGDWHRRGYGYGFYPGLGIGLAFGLGYPWGWGYYPPYDGYNGILSPEAGYYGTAAAPRWYYCANPPGYYPYVAQCNVPWQPVPAS